MFLFPFGCLLMVEECAAVHRQGGMDCFPAAHGDSVFPVRRVQRVRWHSPAARHHSAHSRCAVPPPSHRVRLDSEPIDLRWQPPLERRPSICPALPQSPSLYFSLLSAPGCAAGGIQPTHLHDATDSHDVFIVNNHWHTGFVLPYADLSPPMLPLKSFEKETFVEIGWGDDQFYPCRRHIRPRDARDVRLRVRCCTWPGLRDRSEDALHDI